MIIAKPWFCTKLKIFHPRYHDNVVLIAQYKMLHASPVVIIEFVRSKSLKGQRFCATRETILHCPLESNGKIACYAVPMDKLESWDTAAEVRDLATNVFED